MKFSQTVPCNQCPFTMKSFSLKRLKEFAQDGLFHCHKSGKTEYSEELEMEEFIPSSKSVVCAGMLIFNEKRNNPNQMMRICERLGEYDRKKLNMDSKVR